MQTSLYLAHIFSELGSLEMWKRGNKKHSTFHCDDVFSASLPQVKAKLFLDKDQKKTTLIRGVVGVDFLLADKETYTLFTPKLNHVLKLFSQTRLKIVFFTEAA